jgi:hypothetical protein
MSQDIDLMTNFYGSCMACTAGKLHNADLHATSLSPPSISVGQRLFFDFQFLTTPSVGDNTALASRPSSDPNQKITMM